MNFTFAVVLVYGLLSVGENAPLLPQSIIAVLSIYIIMYKEEIRGKYRQALAKTNGGASNRAGGTAPRGTGGEASTGARTDALPRSGLEAGEIIAWRLWASDDANLLMSVAAVNGNKRTVWPPGEPMTGNPGDHDKVGVHAWKTKRSAFDHLNQGGGGVIGRVALWGEVVEHELGYRAEFGKVLSIDYVDVWNIPDENKRIKNQLCYIKDAETLIRLRKTYGVEQFTLTPIKDDQ